MLSEADLAFARAFYAVLLLWAAVVASSADWPIGAAYVAMAYSAAAAYLLLARYATTISKRLLLAALTPVEPLAISAFLLALAIARP